MAFVILSVSPVLCLASCVLFDFDIQKYYTIRQILFKPTIAFCWKSIFLAFTNIYLFRRRTSNLAKSEEAQTEENQ